MPDELAGLRLDKALSELFPEFSRGRLQRWLKEGAIVVDAQSARARDKTRGGESVVLTRPEEQQIESFVPEPVDLNVVYEDETLLVIDKPAGLVVHPAVGNWSGTLMNGLLHRYPRIADVPRAGIVHRLDKETSGLMVVAKTLEAHCFLVDSLQRREISRKYLALVEGRFVSGGMVDEPIGRHPVDRKKMAVVRNGKHALTHYRIRQRYLAHTLLDVKLETGRTHQIRVHMAHIRHPIVGDPVYAGRKRIPKGLDEETIAVLARFPRQALHARRLGLQHPMTGEEMAWEAPVHDDMQALLDQLEPWKA
jgi:23S rRNA pseudouridine1911/1915/1917 synthase